MGRPRKTVTPVRVGFSLPEDLNTRIEAHLRSDLEHRVPHGDKSKFFEQLVREFFQKLDGTFTEIESAVGSSNGLELSK